MTQQFWFECQHCRRSFAVSTQQAGMQMPCPLCEKINFLPLLSQMRQLPATEPVPFSGRSVNSQSGWWLFSGGLLVGVLTALLAFPLLYYAKSLASESRIEEFLEMGRTEIEQLYSGELWNAWNYMTLEGLPDWQETTQVRLNKQSAYLSYVSYFMFCLSGVGFLAMIASLLVHRSN